MKDANYFQKGFGLKAQVEDDEGKLRTVRFDDPHPSRERHAEHDAERRDQQRDRDDAHD